MGDMDRNWLTTPLEERTVSHVLQRGASLEPDRLAVVDPGEALTYSQLWHASLAVAGGLQQRGVTRGDRVLIMMESHVDHALVWFGTNLAGGVAVPVNTALRGEQLAYVINHSESTVVVTDDIYVERFERIAAEISEVRHVVVRGGSTTAAWHSSDLAELRSAVPAEPFVLHPWDDLGIMYTSGTTGHPKGVIVSQAQTYGRMWPLNIGAPQLNDVTLVTLPIYHVIGQCRGLYNTLIALGTAVLEERFSASAFWDQCRTHGVTYAPLVGVMASYLLRQPPSDADRDNPVERICIGTTIPEADEFAARFDVALTTSYGLTEVGGVLVGPAGAQGCGYVRPDYEAALVDEHDCPVPPGEVGELVLRGREPWTVMAGYLKNAEATTEKWRNLWLHTGDLMRQRPDGEFLFVIRRTESIRRRGENISPTDVERGIERHEKVREVAVVGLEVDGEMELKAVLVPEEGQEVDLDQLVEFLSEEIPYYMIPRYFAVADDLPRTESTRRVQREPLRQAGVDACWDREAAGLRVTRDGLVRVTAR